MKTYYGNYLGIVITGGEKDPEGRGRCQVFIPHIMPTLYDGWNREGQDISFDIVGNGLPESLNPDIVNTLQKILPWAECAAPIVGSSPSVKDGDEIKRNTARAMSVVGGLGPVFTAFAGSDDDNAKYAALTDVAAQQSFASGKCGTAVGEILESVYGYSESQVRDASPDGRRDGKNFNTILQNLGWSAVQVSTPADAPPGSILSYDAVPGNQWGHVEWVGINSSGNKAYYFGLGGINGSSAPGGGSRVGERNSRGFKGIAWVPPDDLNQAKVVPANFANSPYANAGQPNVNPSGIAGGPIPVGTNMDQPPNNQPNYTSEGGSEALANDRQQRFSQEITQNQEQILSRIQALANREVGSNPNAQQAFIETIVNRAYFSNRSLNTIIYEDAYGFKGTDTASPSQSIRNAFENVINGGNITNLATDAGYNLPGAGPGGGNFITGNSEKQVMGVMDIQTGQFVTDQALLNKLNTEGDRSGQYEYFVRQDRAITREGIQAYAQERNIEQGTALAQSSSIQRPTQHSASSGPNTNYQALGMFGYASEGTTVWVFFREGDPHFPVYFAASYGQREWQNMYSYSSPGIGAGAGTGALPGTEKMRLNSYGGGFESVQVSENPESGLDPQFTFQVYGKNGSNLLFTKDHTEFNSTYNHNQRVAGDLHEITEANKEERVRGDKNSYIEQDVYITVGNWTDEAIAASDEIQQYINEAMEIKSNAGKA